MAFVMLMWTPVHEEGTRVVLIGFLHAATETKRSRT